MFFSLEFGDIAIAVLDYGLRAMFIFFRNQRILNAEELT